jgi:Tetratricopeptide repeat
MKQLFFIISLLLFFAVGYAQDSTSALVTARRYTQHRDYNNALVVLNKAIEKDNLNIDLKNELAFTYYLQKDYPRAIGVARPMVDNKSADIKTFQILGMVYADVDDAKEADRMYRDALKRFPESGAMYSEYGQLYFSKDHVPEALKQWEKGIQSDPGYSGNYYNIARFYFSVNEHVWGLLYGEIFINLESYSKRTPEIKTLLLEGYKKLFSESDIRKKQDTVNKFGNAFLTVMKDQSDAVSGGITPATLSALRTRFILEWFGKYAGRFPFRLFEYQQQMARAGLFDAYNQWIFGAADDLSAFQQWTAANGEVYAKFTTFQKNRVFKLPQGQYYHGGH